MSLDDLPPGRLRRSMACAGAALALLTAPATAFAAQEPPPAPGPSPETPRIPPRTVVGGVSASTGTYPWMVALSSRSVFGQERSGQFCGGTLVAADKVLTAAHCLYDGNGRRADLPDLAVVQGRTDLDGTEGQEVAVARVGINPDFVWSRIAGDWAVLTLARPLSAPVAPLVGQDEQVYAPGVEATVLGWGDTTGSGTYPSGLRMVEVPVVPDAGCAVVYPGRFDANSMVCAGFVVGGRDACSGDSGGPMIIGGRLAGIISWGRGCAEPGAPGVYTRVASYADAITSAVLDAGTEEVTDGAANASPAEGTDGTTAEAPTDDGTTDGTADASVGSAVDGAGA